MFNLADHFPLRWSLPLLVLLLSPAPSYAQRKPLPQAELARLRAEEDRRIRFAGDRLNALRGQLGLTEAHSFELRSAITDQWGRLHCRYRQLYRGVRVMGAVAIAHLDEQDRFQEPDTKLFPDIELDVTPAVNAAAARDAVVREISPGGSPPAIQLQLVIVPDRLLIFSEDVSRRVLPEVPSLDEYQWVTSIYRLAWLALSSTDESAADDREPMAWMVDATSGAVLRKWSLRVSDSLRPARGLGHSLYHGIVELSTSFDEVSQDHVLADAARGASPTSNLDSQQSFRKSQARPFRSLANIWGDGARFSPSNPTGSPNGQTPAVDVAFAVGRVWDLLENVFGHAGLDGKRSSIDTRVHFGAGFEGAFWHKSAKAAFFGDGGPQPPTDLETVAHELGHGLWFSLVESEGGEGSESGAIGEGHADIMASLAEFYHLGSGGRGSLLLNVEAPWNWRARMVDPALAAGQRLWDASVSSRPEHAGGAIYGRMFVLLARGSSSNPSSPLYSPFFPNGSAGLGLQEAAQLWYLATVGYLPDEPNFFDLRQAFVQAAAWLYGSSTSGLHITQNAFAAVGLGAPATDTSAPSVSDLVIAQLDEGEGSMLVSALAADDTGVLRVEFFLNSEHVFTRTRPPYAGFIDISRLSPGAHTLLARALDYTIKVGQTSASFGLTGVNQLITDGGFEGGGASWQGGAALVATAAADSFLGARHAAFSGNAALSQRIRINPAATGVTFSFRLRVESVVPPRGDRLEIQVRDENGILLETLATIFDSFDTRDDLSNHYAKRTFSLNAYRGRFVELRLVSAAALGPPRFRVDNVSVTGVEPLSVTAEAEADAGEGSITFRLRNLSGIRPSQVSRVDYLVGGEVFASARADPFTAVISTQGLIRRTYTAVAQVFDVTGQRVIESQPVSFTVSFVDQLVVNGGFESGATGWLLAGQTEIGRDTATVQRAFLGFRYARLGGRGVAHTDELSQKLTVPEEATSATLSFRLRIDTQDTTAADFLRVRVYDSVGAILAELDTFSNLFDTHGPASARGYLKRTYDLSALAGRTIQIHFQARENTGRPTSFLVDNVSITFR